VLHYNIDGDGRAPRPDDDLDAAERLELLRHRCFIRCAKVDDDRWPYGDRFAEEFGVAR